MTKRKNIPVAVVTGGAKRIGRQIAIDLHNAGFDIALHYRSSSAEANTLADELCLKREDSCRVYQADLDDMNEVIALGQKLVQTNQRIDLLVNNASGFSATPIAECTPEAYDAMMSSNLRGAYFLIQSLLPQLRRSKGSIVNILDMHLYSPLKGYSAYMAAKAGLASLTQNLAVELAPEIRVNGVAPGSILWPENDDAYDEKARRVTISKTPLGRFGEPSDIGQAVVFLAQNAPFITGQIITIDGGQSLS